MATKSIAWQTGTGNITLTYTGQGDGPINVVSDVNNGSARSQTIIIQTTKGGVITKNVTVSQGACPFPVGDVKNFSYTGSYQEVELPAGQYKLQCWGAQGGSNGTNSTYGITAKAGGKGGYSEGIITLSQKTTVRVYVGGQGSSSAGGFNGGGSTTGTSQYNNSNEFGYSKMGGGGGATDIRLNDGSLYSRMIVAGGGSGGAACFQEVTTTTTDYITIDSGTIESIRNGSSEDQFIYKLESYTAGKKYRMTLSGVSLTTDGIAFEGYNPYKWIGWYSSGTVVTLPSASSTRLFISGRVSSWTGTYILEEVIENTTTSTDNKSQIGYVGGGTSGGGYSSNYNGKQNGAGRQGSFGQGANQNNTGTRYCSGAGGGGWYGGGMDGKDSNINGVNSSGGGSGWVNTYANRSYRPSGYTGLQLDSGSTTAGSSSFPAPGGGNETGHAGNGYARITRLS